MDHLQKFLDEQITPLLGELRQSHPERVAQLEDWLDRRADIDATNAVALLSGAPPSFLLRPLLDMPFPGRAQSAFLRAGTATVGDLLVAPGVTRKGLVALPGMGRKTALRVAGVLDVEIVCHILGIENPSGRLPGNRLGDDDTDLHCRKVTNFAQALECAQSRAIASLARRRGREQAVERMRRVFRGRLGLDGRRLTFDELAREFGVTRERIRQIHAKCLRHLKDAEGIRETRQRLTRRLNAAGGFLSFGKIRKDAWFRDHPELVTPAAIREVCQTGDNQVWHVLTRLEGEHYLSRISEAELHEMLSEIERDLTGDTPPSLAEAREVVRRHAEARSVPGASGTVFGWLREQMAVLPVKGGRKVVVATRLRRRDVVRGLLRAHDQPVHFREIRRLADQVLPEPVNDRGIHAVLCELPDVVSFSRGRFGLEKHLGMSPSTARAIARYLTERIEEHDHGLQWHCDNLTEMLKREDAPKIPGPIDAHRVNAVLQFHAERLVSLGRMVWKWREGFETTATRVRIKDAVTRMLEDEGRPMTNREIIDRLREMRGLSANFQIHPTDRVLMVAPGTWGLIGRDTGFDRIEETKDTLDDIYRRLKRRGRGMHLDRLSSVMPACPYNFYSLFNLMTADDRFITDNAFNVGLSEWGEIRALTIGRAVEEVVREIPAETESVTLSWVVEQARMLLGRDIEPSVARVGLHSLGWVFDPRLRRWRRAAELEQAS